MKNLNLPELTKLEYFTAMAMQGLLASYTDDNFPAAGLFAERSVGYAKAALSVLEAQQEKPVHVMEIAEMIKRLKINSQIPASTYAELLEVLRKNG